MPTTQATSRMARPRLRATALLSVLVLGLASCGNGGAADSGSDDDPDTLTLATGFTIHDLVPLENGLWAPELGYGDLLMKPVPGGELEPWVLESLEAVSDTQWKLTIREGVTFQNGNSLDAEALTALMDHHLENNPAVTPLLPDATVEATGPLTVEIATGRPVPHLPSLLASEGLFILYDLATYDELAETPEDLVGAGIYTGPYEVTRLTSEVMELEPTDGYYGGSPALAEVTVLFLDDEQARVRAVRSGEADLAIYPPTSAARQLAGADDAVYLVQPEGEATVGQLLFVNQRSPALAEADVRRAVQLATDYDAMADDVMNGLYDRSPGLYPEFLPYALDLLKFDPDEAEDLLDGAGWERAGDGTRTRDGEDLTLRVITYPQVPDINTLAVALESQLGAVGIEVEIIEVEGNYDAMADPDGWELGFSNEHMLDLTGTNPLRPLLVHYHSEGEWNFGGIDDPALDALIDELSETSDEDDQHRLLEEIQHLIVEEGAYGWFVALKRTPAVAAPAFSDYPLPVANLWLSPYS